MDSVERVKKFTRATEVLHKNALAEARTEETLKLMSRVEEIVEEVLKESKGTRVIIVALQRHKTGREGAKIRAECRRFMDAVGSFERIQEEYRERYRQQLERQYRLIDPDLRLRDDKNLSTSLSTSFLNDSHTSLMLSQQIFKLADDSKSRRQLEILKERNTEMHQLEKGIDEVRALFAEISTLISEQGDQVNKVEDYVLELCANTEKTAGVLDQTVAMHRKKQARRRAAMMIGVVILTLLLGIIFNELGIFSFMYRIVGGYA